MAEDQVQEIKNKIDIVSLISGYLPLKKAGRNYKALCPFHSEKTPSFMVSPEIQIFKCFGCGAGGDHFAFLKQVEGMEFKDSLEYLAQKAGVKLKGYKKSDQDLRRERLLKLHNLAAEAYHHLLTSHKIGKEAYKYLTSRGITDDSIETFLIGYAPNSWEAMGSIFLSKKYTLSEIIDSGLAIAKEGGRRFYDRFRGRIMLPIKDPRGRVIGFSGRVLGDGQPKYMNSPETTIFNKSSTLSGFDLTKRMVKSEKNAFIVEGLFDVISLYQAGIKNVTASLGTALTISQTKLLSKVTDTITFCFDTDRAGDEATKRGIKLAQQQNLNIKVALIPQGKDPDESVREDRKAFVKILNEAVPINDFYFESALKRHNAQTPLGKKRIAQELLPIISAILNPIERDHYVNQLAQRLEVGLEVVQKALLRHERVKEETFNAQSASRETLEDFSTPKIAVEEYILALLFKAPLVLAQRTLRKLSRVDFTDEVRVALFVALKKYLTGRKRRFDVKTFRAKLGDNEQKLADKLYLWDIDDALGFQDTEIEHSFKLVRERSLKRSLKRLGEKIKQAEVEKDSEKLKALQEQFQALSEKLT